METVKPKFELGPIQKAWIKSLREHPERQTTKKLGRKINDTDYQACCLGEGGLIAGVCMWENGELNTIKYSTAVLNDGTYKALGLFDAYGSNNIAFAGDTARGTALSALNDGGFTWAEIADRLENNPEEWFTEPK